MYGEVSVLHITLKYFIKLFFINVCIAMYSILLLIYMQISGLVDCKWGGGGGFSLARPYQLQLVRSINARWERGGGMWSYLILYLGVSDYCKLITTSTTQWL